MKAKSTKKTVKAAVAAVGLAAVLVLPTGCATMGGAGGSGLIGGTGGGAGTGGGIGSVIGGLL